MQVARGPGGGVTGDFVCIHNCAPQLTQRLLVALRVIGSFDVYVGDRLRVVLHCRSWIGLDFFL